MPKLGLTQESAGIVEWRKQVGDHVAVGEILVVIETDKAMAEVEAEVAGVVRELLVAEGDEVDVFAPIAIVEPAAG